MTKKPPGSSRGPRTRGIPARQKKLEGELESLANEVRTYITSAADDFTELQTTMKTDHEGRLVRLENRLALAEGRLDRLERKEK